MHQEGLPDDQGILRTYSAAIPGPGTEISLSVPNFARWLILDVKLILTTTNSLAARRVTLQTRTGAAVTFSIPARSTQPIFTTHTYYFTAAGPDRATVIKNTHLYTYPRRLLLPPESVLETLTTNLFELDQYEEMTLYVMEWLNA